MLRRKMFERISGGSAAIGESFSVDMADICVRSGVCLSPASGVSDVTRKKPSQCAGRPSETDNDVKIISTC